MLFIACSSYSSPLQTIIGGFRPQWEYAGTTRILVVLGVCKCPSFEFKYWMAFNAKWPRNKAILIWATFNASDSSIHELIIFMSKWTALCIIFPCAQQKRGRKKGKSSKIECKKCHFNSVLSVSFAKYRQFWNISPFFYTLHCTEAIFLLWQDSKWYQQFCICKWF